jgi:hypothetical protein
MKHKWKIHKLSLTPNPERFCETLGGELRSTDRRRKAKFFAVDIVIQELTLEGLAKVLLDGQQLINISEGSRPKGKKNGPPPVDPRQIEMFKGGFDESDKTAVDETVWKTFV